jgi:hypothetical protein
MKGLTPALRLPTPWLMSLVELKRELGRDAALATREARRSRSPHVGRPRALDKSKAAVAQQMHANCERAGTIATEPGATVYRVLGAQIDDLPYPRGRATRYFLL